VISPDVGFVCRIETDYRKAIESVGKISSLVCREKAMRNYHYHLMAKGFVREYEEEIVRPTQGDLISDLEATIYPTGGRGL